VKFSSILSEDLRQKHGKRAVRVREGDTVKILKGEFKGIEGKVTKVDASNGTLNVEGVTREKVAGGTAPVPIGASNVYVTNLNLEDKLRKNKMGGD
jgi:large subunit ribosomal protein L24